MQNFDNIKKEMENCFQFENINMIQHGEMVHEWYIDLFSSKEKIWDFGKVHNQILSILTLAATPENLKNYHIYHDLGKPFCRTVDENGRQHFPNHAQVSYETWINAGGDEETAWYILHDMDFHLLKTGEINELITDRRAINLLLTAWCEIHANSQMFGGIESTSFKIKRKSLEKHTKALYNSLIDKGLLTV